MTSNRKRGKMTRLILAALAALCVVSAASAAGDSYSLTATPDAVTVAKRSTAEFTLTATNNTDAASNCFLYQIGTSVGIYSLSLAAGETVSVAYSQTPFGKPLLKSTVLRFELRCGPETTIPETVATARVKVTVN